MNNIIFRLIKKGRRLLMGVLLISACLFHLGCKKLVEVQAPATSISSSNVFSDDATAIGAITALYGNLANWGVLSPGEFSGLSGVAGLSADELTLYSGSSDAMLSVYYQNVLTSTNGGFSDYWTNSYTRMYIINSAIEGLTASKSLTPSVKQQLMGETKFMRAFYYFYLVNLYGGVPLVLETEYTKNALIARSTKEEVYKQVVSDLKDAQGLLSDKYVKGDTKTTYPASAEERVRPTKWAATTLLARTYLYLEDWANAEAQAATVLENQAEYQIESLENAFIKNNKEAIWQLQPVMRVNTRDAGSFVLPSSGPWGNNPVYLSDRLMSAFEANDLRKKKWIDSTVASGVTYYYPYKYKVMEPDAPVTEYTTVFRFAELYLIRAEARAQQNNLSGAAEDLDVIRDRAGLDGTTAANQEDLLTAIRRENQVEFFTEWGHRWLDLKRTHTIDEVMSVVTPEKNPTGTWQSYQQYYPILLWELRSNPSLVQNEGYK